jgi:hypothetical protein
MPESLWYIRFRGRVSGPFTAGQLASMRERGQFSRFHEVAMDRQNWVGAARVPELFPPAESRIPAPGSGSRRGGGSDFSAGVASEQASFAVPASDDAGSSWFYARGGTHHGPVAYEDLRRMAAEKEIDADTLLWKSGMADWVACRSFPDLASLAEGISTNVATTQPSHIQSPFGFVSDSGFLPRTSGLAVASLVLGILWLCGIGSLLAAIFGGVALGQIARSKGRLAGKEMAIAGLVLGIIGLASFGFLFFAGMLSSALERLQNR